MPHPNQRIGEYLLDVQIGRGTFGEVWRARHHAWPDQVVAVKIPTDPRYLQNLRHEGAPSTASGTPTSSAPSASTPTPTPRTSS